MNTVDFDKLVGETAQLYYCNELRKFQLGSVVFEVFEDVSDGYRSMLGEVGIVSRDATKSIPLATVKIHSIDGSYFQGYRLIGVEDQFVWVEFVTGNWDDWYPYFTFNS